MSPLRIERTRLAGGFGGAFVALAGAAMLGGCAAAPPSGAPTHSVITVVGSQVDVDAFVTLVDARRHLPTFAEILAAHEPAPVFVVGYGALVHQYLPEDRRLESEAFPGDLFLSPGVQYVDLADLAAFPLESELGSTVPRWAVSHDQVLIHVLAETAHSASRRTGYAAAHEAGISAENRLRVALGQEGRILYRHTTMDGSRTGHPILETAILNESGGIWVERVHSDRDGEIRSIEYFEAGLLVATRWIGPATAAFPGLDR